MSEEKVIKLFTDGEVSMGNRSFTRLMGGFNEDEATLSDLQVASILEYKHGARQVREQVNRNISHFEFGLNIIDLQRDALSDTSTEILKTLGYAKQSITQATHIYLFSQSGFLLFLKFAEGDKAIEIYKDFIEDYFKTKAENQIMKDSIEDEIKALIEDKATLLGKSIMAKTENDRIELAKMVEDKNRRIVSLEKTKSEKEIIAKVQDKINIADGLGSAKGNIDMGNFAKVIGVENMGRNNLFKWFREQQILKSDNVPYQQYMKYFFVQAIPGANGYTYYKTLIKPTAIGYILKRLEKDGKIVTKSVEDILDKINKTA